jgi:hypothetical protein
VFNEIIILRLKVKGSGAISSWPRAVAYLGSSFAMETKRQQTIPRCSVLLNTGNKKKGR